MKQKAGNNIAKILMQQNKRQVWLAGQVGVKREYINRIINGRIMPTIPLALQIAWALGVKVEDIFYLV
jgi:DNA-binding XRE family transcriptional regulator